MTLLVCSTSTRKYLPQYERVEIISEPPKKDILEKMNSEEDVVAIGGGAVIDAAKIISRNPIVCYPTTASGSTATSWAVYWDGTNKNSIECQLPNQVHFKSSFMQGLPDDILINTTCDALSHCLDSLNSTKSTELSLKYCKEALGLLEQKENKEILLKAGHLAGKAIQITGTNLLHCLSYPMTGHYNIPHGKALAYLLPRIGKLMADIDINTIIYDCHVELTNIDFNFIVDEALKYDKIYESKLSFDATTLKELLNEEHIFKN